MTALSKGIVTVGGLLVCLWFGGFLTYFHDIQQLAPASPEKAGGIVILTGSPARLNTGFDLLTKGAGSRLLVSGVNSKVTRETLRQALGQSSNLMDCCVDLGRVAQNTVGNAEEAARWAETHNFKSLIIVTSAYHMPRSLVELKRQLPNTKLIAYPVKSILSDTNGEWLNAKSLVVVIGEYNKYLFSLVRSRLEARDPKESNA
ncbi:MAG: YdcF family protein [Proteobacteria bacterium]|nr:YdcF family protein [Pseudomonadota bacterium]